MANTYTLIQAQTLASSAATVTFSSIPATYTDLVLRCSTRDTVAGAGNGSLALTFNGIATNYHSIFIRGNGSAAASSSGGGGVTTYIDAANGITADSAGNTASTFANTEIYVPSYLVSQNKPVSTFSVSENNSATAFLGAAAGIWANNAAITSLIMAATTAFDIGSSFYLYGIKNS